MYSDDEFELLKAVDRFKSERGIPFPSVIDILRVMKSLGYEKSLN